MTISTTAARVRYDGDGATTVFPIPFKFVQNAHVRATLRDVSGGETLWAEGTHYSLSGAKVEGGGSLTVKTSPTNFVPREGETLVIELDVPYTQQKAFPLGGAFPSTQVEEGLDLAAQQAAQLAAFDKRLLRVPATDTRLDADLELPLDSLRAGKYLGFDAAGRPALLSGTAEAADLSDKTVLPTGAGVARTMADLFGLGALTGENVKLYGAKGDLVELADGTVTDGSAVLSSASVNFTDADVGKDITVEGAAQDGTTITAVEKAPADNVVQFDASAGTSVDLTADFNDIDSGSVLPFPATEAVGDMFLIGHRAPFGALTVAIGTSGVGGTVQWKYWDGSAWQNLAVTDNTSGFTAAPGSHTVIFTPPVDWVVRKFNEKDNQDLLYYVGVEITVVYTTNPVLDHGTIDDGEIRVATLADHGFQAGQTISIKGVAGATEANGTFVIRHARSAENIDRSRFDLIGSNFGSAYVSGGTAHGRLITTIVSVSGSDATLGAAAGASLSSAAKFRYGTDDTAAVQAAIDSGETVIVPPGNYICGGLTIGTKGQRIVGNGGRIIAKSTAGAPVRQIDVTADEVTLEGLILENPDEQTQNGSTRPAAIHIQANKARIAGNRLASYQDGIIVSSSGEYFGTAITGNHVLRVVGRSDESRGDGIVSWGADTLISGNYVTAKGWDEGVGMQGDPRIGIHVENLGSLHIENSYRYEDNGAVITGNIVKGKFRRGIFSEGVAHTTIAGNEVASSTWYGIGVSGGADTSSYVISSNTILYDRPSQDQTEFGATPAAIEVRSVNSDLRGVQVIGNSVEISGTGVGVELIGQSSELRDVVVSGNSFRSTDLKDPGMVGGVTTLNVHGFTISDNTFRGCSGDVLFNFAWAQAIVEGNQVSDASGADVFDFGNGEDVVDQFAIFANNNIVWSGSGQGIEVVNRDNVIVQGNRIQNASGSGTAIDLFGVDPAIVNGNILTMSSGNYISNFISSSTKLDVNNVKN